MLNTVYLPTASADGKDWRTWESECHSAFRATRYQTSSGTDNSAWRATASRSFFRLMTCTRKLVRKLRTSQVHSSGQGSSISEESPESAVAFSERLQQQLGALFRAHVARLD